MKGEAEALAIEAKARAEANTMVQKAAALQEYKDAAMLEMYLSTLPKVREGRRERERERGERERKEEVLFVYI